MRSQAIQNLIDKLSSLPSVGPKTAERYVFYLLKRTDGELKDLAQTISELKEKTSICKTCGLISEQNPCSICSDSSRDQESLCIVENTQDLLSVESTKQYNGRYFILGGLINTIRDIKPEDLRTRALLEYLKKNEVKEIILALNFTMEGETTSLYLQKILENYKITKLAKGMPAGSDLEYADEITLANALKNRI